MQTPAQLVTQARALAQSGQYNAARTAYRQAIAAMPRNPELLVELGVLAGQHGDFANARRSLEKASKLDSEDPNIPFNLGQVAKAEGHYERAAHFFRQTLQIDPSYHEALFDLGECLLSGGKAAEALPVLDKAVETTPNDAMAHHTRGLALYELDDKAGAKDAYKRAIKLDPGHVNSRLGLADVEAETGAPWVAIDLIDSVEADGLMVPETFSFAARVLHRVGELRRAMDYINKCLEANVDVNPALMTRAKIARDLGRFADAEADLRKLVGYDPAWAYQQLGVISRLEPEAQPKVKRLAESASVSPEERALANFALYRLLDRAGNYDAAFEALQRAKRLRAASAPADLRKRKVLVERMVDTFSPQFMRERTTWGCQKPGAVYIVGMPRSGTTLTEHILAAHPRVFAGGERYDVMRLRTQIAGWPEGFTAVTEQGCERMGADLHEKLTSGSGPEDLTTDKAPGNFMSLGFIRSVLPQAKLIYVRRNPADNMLSLYEQDFGENLKFANDLDNIVESYRLHVRIMKHWISTCEIPVHTVDYDALVADPEPHIRALLDFVGIEFDSRCLKPEEVEREVRTASVWQVRQPISAASSGRWRRYERQLAPYVRALEEAQ